MKSKAEMTSCIDFVLVDLCSPLLLGKTDPSAGQIHHMRSHFWVTISWVWSNYFQHKNPNYFWLVVFRHPSEKWWTSSVGMMTFPSEWKVIKAMFQTTHQISPDLLRKRHNILWSPTKKWCFPLIHLITGHPGLCDSWCRRDAHGRQCLWGTGGTGSSYLEIGRLGTSLDWFCWENLQETMVFIMKYRGFTMVFTTKK